MKNQYRAVLQPSIAQRTVGRIRPAATRAGQALGVALAMLGAGTRFVPLGDNRQLFADLANTSWRAHP